MTTIVYVTSTTESQRENSAGNMNAAIFLKNAIERASDERCKLTDDPCKAELILFAESHLNTKSGVANPSVRVKNHPIYQEFSSKCVIHNGSDKPCPVVPGLYPSLSSKWANRLGCIGAPYLAELNPYIEAGHEFDGNVDKLGSFMGSCARKPIRIQLTELAQKSSWNDIRCIDSTASFIGSIRANDHDAHHELKKLFVRDILRSKFSLCPRGTGASSYRIFEAMQARRAPVIISDAWSPPPGPNWDSFTIRIHQSQITQLPAILNERKSEWETMGNLARKTWERYYSPKSLGKELVRLGLQVIEINDRNAFKRKGYASVYRLGVQPLDRLKSKVSCKISRRINRPE